MDSKVEEILRLVSKPARYIGNEINIVRKEPEDVDIRFCFCFPDTYEVGMSHLGMEILYYFLNRRPDTYCERAYAPWHDMEENMRKNNIPLFTLETHEHVSLFDFVAFTLQYELSYTNILNMLSLAGIPLYSKDRTDDHPIIICGGSGAYNPEPLADFVDFFYIGEGEVLYDEILDLYKDAKQKGLNKTEFLKSLLTFDGIYIPMFYDVSYKENGEIEKMEPNEPMAPSVVTKVVVKDLDKAFYPDKKLTPLIEVVFDRAVLELFRGCVRGCRFCQAGFVYRPVREKSVATLMDQARLLIDSSGYEEISLLSLSTSDYSCFRELAEGLIEEFFKKNVNISLPSLRIDSFFLDLMEKLYSDKKPGLTFAPEAGTQRLRDVINKNLTEEEILTSISGAFKVGFNRVKLYFMIGLPTENEEDLIGIAKLSAKIVEKYYEEKKVRPITVTISNSLFVPKPFTPFQWDKQDDFDSFLEKARLIKSHIKNKHIKYNYHEINSAIVEGVLARGARRVSKVLYNAFKAGCKFDGWSDCFNPDKWAEAFQSADVDPYFYTRERTYTEILPWDHIHAGATKEYLINEREKALKEITTPNCRLACKACGAGDLAGGLCDGLQA